MKNTKVDLDAAINILSDLPSEQQDRISRELGVPVSDLVDILFDLDNASILLESNEEMSEKLSRLKTMRADPYNLVAITSGISIIGGGSLALLVGSPLGIALFGFGVCGGALTIAWNERVSKIRKYIGK